MSKKPKKLTVYRINADNTEKVAEIADDLVTYQQIVGGYVEQIRLGNGLLMIVDDEGRLKNKPINMKASRFVPGNTIVGDVFIVGDNDGASFESLTEAELEMLKEVVSR